MEIFISAEMGYLDEPVIKKFRAARAKVEKMIQENLLNKNDYGNALVSLGIIPMILPKEFYERHPDQKERKLYSPKRKDADFRLKIDYEALKTSTAEEIESLLIKNILEAVRILRIKIKSGFDVERLEGDILKLFSK